MDLSNNVVVDVNKGHQEFLQFKKLLKYSDIVTHAYSVGIDKNYRTFKANKKPLLREDYIKNMNNYKTLCEANNLNYKNIIKANQAHTDNIVNVTEIPHNKTIDTGEVSDGLITNKKI